MGWSLTTHTNVNNTRKSLIRHQVPWVVFWHALMNIKIQTILLALFFIEWMIKYVQSVVVILIFLICMKVRP